MIDDHPTFAKLSPGQWVYFVESGKFHETLSAIETATTILNDGRTVSHTSTGGAAIFGTVAISKYHSIGTLQSGGIDGVCGGVAAIH